MCVCVRVSGQLKANNAQLMQEAVQAMQNLAQQCSDPTAVQDVVTHLFKILGGDLPTGLLKGDLCCAWVDLKPFPFRV